MTFYDAHLHCPNKEAAGFYVGLEGTPVFPGTMTNDEVLRLHNPAKQCVAFEYVTFDRTLSKGAHPFLKYHPRREKYTPDQVIESIRFRQPQAVMIDTLNEPFWTPYDYWNVARAFPTMPFIFPHSGGYLIQDFIKICHFQKNVWIDFALTHTNFGGISSNPLPSVDQAITFALHAPFNTRILLGSDYPFFSQDAVVSYYRERDVLSLLNENYLRLVGVLCR